MNRTSYIIIFCLVAVFAATSLKAQEDGRDTLSVVDVQLDPSSISIAGRMYALPHVSVMENGNVGASPVLMLRGVTSIMLSSSPLVYVDGIPLRYNSAIPAFLSTYEPDRLGFLNPYDVADIAVHPSGIRLPAVGGRGANGTIDVRTERGEFGGTKIDVQANYGINTADITIPRFDAAGMKSYLWTRFQEEGLSPAQINAHPVFSDTHPGYNHQTDWVDMIRQNAAFQDYHVKLKGGDGDANYLFGVGYTNKEGMITNTNFERVGLRFNLDYDLAHNIKIYNNLSYNNSSTNYGEFGHDYAIHPLYVASAKAPFLGTHYVNPNGEQSRLLADVDTLGLSNPIALVENLQNQNRFNRIDGVMGVHWTLAADWMLSSSLSVSYFNLAERQYRPALGIVSDRYRIRQNSKRNSSEFYLNWNARLAKSGMVNDNTTYEGSIQAAVETFEEKSMFGRKINAGTDDFETLEQGIVDSASNVRFRSNLMTFAGRGALFWNERVDVDAFVNLQGSSNFGSRGRWNLYPAIHTTFYMIGERPVNKLNVQLSYDRTGNHEVRGFYHYTQYYPVNYYGFGAVYLGNIANPNLKPEITDTYEARVAIRPWGTRMQVNIGYYYKHTSDLITHKAVVKELGVEGFVENAGTLANQGLEVGIAANLLAKNDLRWDASASVSTLNNKILSLPNGDIEQSLGIHTGIARDGHALGSFYGYRVLGVFETDAAVNLNKSDGTPYLAGDYRMEDINGDGKINALDKQVLGSPLPKVFGHLMTNFSYKNWGVSALINFVHGADIYNSFAQQMHVMKDYANQDPAVQNRWQSSTDPGAGLSRAVVGDPSGNGAFSSLWVEDGSYAKLKNITLFRDFSGRSYTTFFKNIRLYLSMDNLVTLTRYSGFDPEVHSLNNPMLRNIDFGAPPLNTTYKLGFKASF